MKIGILCYPTYGGSGIVATELGMEMAKKNHEIHFISYSLPARLDITLPNIHFHHVQIQSYPLFEYQPYDLALTTMVYDIAIRYGLDAIHVHYAIPHAYAAYFTKQMLKEKGIYLPIITTLHGTDITLVGKHPSYKSAVEFSINQSDVVTCVSESLKKDTLQLFEIQKELLVIPNFIDNELFKKDTPCNRSNFANSDEKILIHVSNLRKVKRVTDVIEIFNKVQQKIKSKLIIVGEGPESNAMEELIHKYQLQNKVRLIGKTLDLYPILCMSDLFLLPSEQESFGLAALEAMAAKLPVISTNTGGIPEVNKNGFSGFTSNIGDVESMANNAISILENDTILLKFKNQAKEQAMKFDKKNILPMYEKMYFNIVNSHIKA